MSTLVRFLVFSILLSFFADPGRSFAQVDFEPPVPVTTAIDDGGFGPAIATNGSGTWVAIWDSSATLGGAIPGSDREIFFARSTDGGLSFGPAAPLNTDFLTDSTTVLGQTWADSDYDAAIAAHGNRFVATWHRSTTLDNRIMLARSDDGGASWTPPLVLRQEGYRPTIADDEAGTWIVAWENDRSVGADREIYFSRSSDDGNTWSPPAALNANAVVDARNDIHPTLAFAGGVWIATWSAVVQGAEAEDAEAMVARSVDGGVTWSMPVMLNASGPGELAEDLDARAAGDGTGTWVVLWGSGLANGESDLLAARSTDGGLSWSAAVPMNTDFATDTLLDGRAHVSAGPPGTFVAVWRRDEFQTGTSDVLTATATSVDGGLTWSPPVFINGPAAVASVPYATELDPNLTYDAASGRYVAVWAGFDPKLASGTFPFPGELEIVMAFAGHPCGDGVVGPGETCDDGDRGAADCCGRTCQFDAPNTVCGADADRCTLERCDGAGTCGHVNAPAGTRCDADTDICTFDRCDAGGVCEHVYEPPNDCVPAVKPRHSTLRISNAADPAKRKLAWTWKHGAPMALVRHADGDPYTLCLFDGTGLIDRFDVPAGGTCGPQGANCWSPSGKVDLKYVDPDGTPHGITRVTSKSSGVPGKSSIKIEGRGANLPMPTLPIASPPVHAVFVSDYLERCFTATYSTKLTNDGTVFKAKSQ